MDFLVELWKYNNKNEDISPNTLNVKKQKWYVVHLNVIEFSFILFNDIQN